MEALLGVCEPSGPQGLLTHQSLQDSWFFQREDLTNVSTCLEGLLRISTLFVLRSPGGPVESPALARELSVDDWMECDPDRRAFDAIHHHLRSDPLPLPGPSSPASYTCVACLLMEEFGVAHISGPLQGPHRSTAGAPWTWRVISSTVALPLPTRQGCPAPPPPSPLGDWTTGSASMAIYFGCDYCGPGARRDGWLD